MKFIISKVDVRNFKCSVLDITDTKSQAIYKLHNCYCADVDTAKVYVKRDGDDTYVEEYKFSPGYVYNSKNLAYVYRIIEYQAPSEFKEELDEAIEKRKKKTSRSNI